MKVVPLGDNVVIKRREAEATFSGGIVLPDAARSEVDQGRVLSVGDGRMLANGTRAASQVCEGDWVVFRPRADTELSIDDEELLIMNQNDILAVVRR